MCFSVSSVVTFPTHRDGQGLLKEKKKGEIYSSDYFFKYLQRNTEIVKTYLYKCIKLGGKKNILATKEATNASEPSL